MTTKAMLQFVSRDKEMPAKRKAEARKGDFLEIYDDFNDEKAALQAGRCSQCGVPFCQTHCPLQNNIPDWLMLTAEGRMQEAYEVSAATNTFPEICGRICPQDRLCEGNCVIEKGFESVTIGAVERHITETAFENGWVKPPQPMSERTETIGIIGAGPAGLAAAEQLRRQGYQITVYDRYDRVGGLLIYGIPGFKLEKEVVTRREALLRDGGIRFELNCQIGDDISFDQIKKKHDAVLIATGVYKARDIELKGKSDSDDQIVPALDYLTASNRLGLGDNVAAHASGQLDVKGKNVVVIGGGDTAMDCVRTAIRQEAKSVTCVYRRDRANMPGSAREVMNAEEEGVKFEWLSQPTGLARDADGKVAGVICQRSRLGAADTSGRQSPEPIENSDYRLDADMVIMALGFDPEDMPNMFHEPRLKVSRWGTISIDWRTMMTSVDGVFAAGDIVRGASLVVWGIRDGRDAATQIDGWLTRQAADKEISAEQKAAS
ncbi:MAG: NAD(P)-dependent oxidoreductase [Alphaproteobacteria bacterium]|nr:NAD(P)-dependent oxidoreductase [Alphaproteobacteria bacterium]